MSWDDDDYEPARALSLNSTAPAMDNVKDSWDSDGEASPSPVVAVSSQPAKSKSQKKKVVDHLKEGMKQSSQSRPVEVAVDPIAEKKRIEELQIASDFSAAEDLFGDGSSKSSAASVPTSAAPTMASSSSFAAPVLSKGNSLELFDAVTAADFEKFGRIIGLEALEPLATHAHYGVLVKALLNEALKESKFEVLRDVLAQVTQLYNQAAKRDKKADVKKAKLPKEGPNVNQREMMEDMVEDKYDKYADEFSDFT